MDLTQPRKKKVLSAAAGLKPAELVLKNASFVNVFTSEVQVADIAICCGIIAGIGSYHGFQELDMAGKVVVPGLIDAHMHIETSMVSPAQLSSVLTAHGTTTLITDPHEIANVMGADGIRYMLQATEGLTLDVRVMLPSCVPAAALEDGNAVLRAAELEPFYKHPRVLGLAELMCYQDAADGDPDILSKIDSAARRGLRTDGHAPGLSGKTLNAYVAAGVRADHECSTLAEAMEKLSLGQYIMIREGTAAHHGGRGICGCGAGLCESGWRRDHCGSQRAEQRNADSRSQAARGPRICHRGKPDGRGSFGLSPGKQGRARHGQVRPAGRGQLQPAAEGQSEGGVGLF